MFFRRLKDDVYARMRKRLVRETEAALLYGLTFPERVPRIPTLEAGTGVFHPAFAAQWWQSTLDLDSASYQELCRGPKNSAILPEYRRY